MTYLVALILPVNYIASYSYICTNYVAISYDIDILQLGLCSLEQSGNKKFNPIQSV